MRDVETKVKLLIDVLDEKQRLLTQVLNITENQESLLLSEEPHESIASFFSGMNQEKQKLIDRAFQADAVFQHTYDGISVIFEQYAQNNKEQVSALQERVRLVMDTDIKIRVLELRNKEHIAKHKKGRRIDIPKAQKGYVLEQYRKFSQKDD